MKPSEESVYTIHRCAKAPSLEACPGIPAVGWGAARVAEISHFHKASGENRPRAFFRALYDARALYVRFDVMDRVVRSVRTELHSDVCVDSCVEFFLQPPGGPEYFNCEVNACGTMLLYRIDDVRVVGGERRLRFTPVDRAWCGKVERHTSLSGKIEKAVEEPLAWTVAYKIPFALFAAYKEFPAPASGTEWRGNMYKCAGNPGETEGGPHWAAWADIGRRLDFHQPRKFGRIVFG